MNTKIFGGSHYSCFCPLQHGRNYDSIPPLEECWRYLQRGEAYGVQYSDSQVVVPLLLILAGDIEVNPGPARLLTVNDHYKVTKVLKKLDKNDLRTLGEALGLSYPKLKKLEPLCEEMVEAWLNKEDNVSKIGEPTWERLKVALKEIGQTGLADDVTQGDYIENETSLNENAESISTPSGEVSLPPQGGVKEKFPHLIKLEKMSEEEKEDLKERLILESDEMMEKFSVLVGKTISSCKQDSFGVSDLRAVLKNYSAGKVLESLDSGTDTGNMWEKIADYWSFFDYKILSIIIKGLCKDHADLLQDLNEYVSDIKEYCKRRLCEVPIDSFSKGIHDKEHRCFNVKFDPPNGFFTSVENIAWQNKSLSKILETKVRLCEFEDGCINFVYISLRELDDTFSLSNEQEQKLSSIGVLRMYSNTKIFYENITVVATSVLNGKEAVTDEYFPRQILVRLGHHGPSSPPYSYNVTDRIKSQGVSSLRKYAPLAPSRAEGVDIPPPFDNYHTINEKELPMYATVDTYKPKKAPPPPVANLYSMVDKKAVHLPSPTAPPWIVPRSTVPVKTSNNNKQSYAEKPSSNHQRSQSADNVLQHHHQHHQQQQVIESIYLYSTVQKGPHPKPKPWRAVTPEESMYSIPEKKIRRPPAPVARAMPQLHKSLRLESFDTSLFHSRTTKPTRTQSMDRQLQRPPNDSPLIPQCSPSPEIKMFSSLPSSYRNRAKRHEDLKHARSKEKLRRNPMGREGRWMDPHMDHRVRGSREELEGSRKSSKESSLQFSSSWGSREGLSSSSRRLSKEDSPQFAGYPMAAGDAYLDQEDDDEEAPPLPPRNYTWSDIEDSDDDLLLSDDDLDEPFSTIISMGLQKIYDSFTSHSSVGSIEDVINQIVIPPNRSEQVAETKEQHRSEQEKEEQHRSEQVPETKEQHRSEQVPEMKEQNRSEQVPEMKEQHRSEQEKEEQYRSEQVPEMKEQYRSEQETEEQHRSEQETEEQHRSEQETEEQHRLERETEEQHRSEQETEEQYRLEQETEEQHRSEQEKEEQHRSEQVPETKEQHRSEQVPEMKEQNRSEQVPEMEEQHRSEQVAEMKEQNRSEQVPEMKEQHRLEQETEEQHRSEQVPEMEEQHRSEQMAEQPYDTLENVTSMHEEPIVMVLSPSTSPSSVTTTATEGGGAVRNTAAADTKLEEFLSLTPREIKLIKQQQKLLQKLQEKMTKEAERRRRWEERKLKKEEAYEQRRKVGRKKKKGKQKPNERSRYFGSPLASVVDEDGVPIFVRKCVQIIEEIGMNSEGIYHIPGKKEHCLAFQEKVDQDPNLDISSLDYQESCISSSLKAFFKLLPEPLIPNETASQILAINYLDQIQVHAILSSMPHPNLCTLRFFVAHLHRVHQRCEINKMNASKLAIVFWPILMRPPIMDLADPSKQLGWHLVMTRIIQHPNFIPP